MVVPAAASSLITDCFQPWQGPVLVEDKNRQGTVQFRAITGAKGDKTPGHLLT